MKKRVLNGIDHIASVDGLLRGNRLGLLTNPTGVMKDLTATLDYLSENYRLTALYSPEHGVRGDAQGSVPITDTLDPLTGLPSYTLHGTNARLNEENTRNIDMMVVDIQDVGARFYTYLYAMSYSMADCKRLGIPMVIFDRINPIGGVKVEGTVLDERFRSLAGDYSLPTRTGVTMGELARYLAGTRPDELGCQLTVVPCEGWTRDTYADETDLPWVITSPNMPTVDCAEVYIGTCIFEGTNVSEGRGTTIPYQIVGSPWLDSYAVVRAMKQMDLPGVLFRPGFFTPTFTKYAGELCHAVQLHVTDRRAFRSFETGLYLMEAIQQLHPGSFAFRDTVIDRLMGTDRFRTGQLTAAETVEYYQKGIREYQDRIRPYLLYE